MSDESLNLHRRLLAHLLDPSDEDERRRLELAALEDDEFFDQLRAAEAELLDSYVQGDLNDAESLRLAELVGRSRRLQESAETTLAIHAHQREVLTAPAPDELRNQPAKEDSVRVPTSLIPEPAIPTPAIPKTVRNLVALSVLAALLLYLTWQVFSMKLQLNDMRQEMLIMIENQQSLEADLQALDNQLDNLRQDQLGLQRQWAREQMENE